MLLPNEPFSLGRRLINIETNTADPPHSISPLLSVENLIFDLFSSLRSRLSVRYLIIDLDQF